MKLISLTKGSAWASPKEANVVRVPLVWGKQLKPLFFPHQSERFFCWVKLSCEVDTFCQHLQGTVDSII